MSDHPLGALLRAMATEGTASRRPSSLPLPEAQADTLRERLAELHRTELFQVGDLVTWKPGWDERDDQWRDQPNIVVDLSVAGYPCAQVQRGQNISRPDMVVASLLSDGRASMFLADSRTMTRWIPPAATPTGEGK